MTIYCLYEDNGVEGQEFIGVFSSYENAVEYVGEKKDFHVIEKHEIDEFIILKRAGYKHYTVGLFLDGQIDYVTINKLPRLESGFAYTRESHMFVRPNEQAFYIYVNARSEEEALSKAQQKRLEMVSFVERNE